MLHHHGGAGSPPFLDPTAGTAPFSPTPTGPVSVTSVPPPLQPSAGTTSTNFEELPVGTSGGATAAANLQEDDMPADVVGAGAGGGAGASGSGGTRWPREETLALIRIRTEMDAEFRNAPLKAPLWEDVAR